MQLDWYWRRARSMSPAELGRRALDRGRQIAWTRRQVHPGQQPALDVDHGPRPAPAPLAPGTAAAVADAPRRALLHAAEGLLDGHGVVLGVPRPDLADPDWFLDPISGRRAPQDRYAFRIDHREHDQTGDVKQIWELSRHHHLTILAAAWYCTGDERYADVVDRQLRSWWRENPFLSGVHWTSGIELGIRLIAWVWIRRLLDDWPPVAALFEHNDDAVAQVYWHQTYLATFPSRGSSANNHAVAESAGQLIGSCGFPWFSESPRWRSQAAARLERHLEHNTFPSGLDRELASAYHGFVAELGMLAAVEADAAHHPLLPAVWTRLCRMVDAAYAIVDERLQPPRQGDSDEGRALVVDGDAPSGWSAMLASGAVLFRPLPWWQSAPATVERALLTSLVGSRRDIGGRPEHRPSRFADAGISVLRTDPADGPEIWCRCDGGPHGYLSIAAHAHADALSVEVRYGGVEILADPGTYCYHGEPRWRAYFRSTVGHNTIEIAGRDQSESGGPFLWTRHAVTRADQTVDDGDAARWSAEHDGYEQLDLPAQHRRSVTLERRRRRLTIVDRLTGSGRQSFRVAFHLGPAVGVEVRDNVARLMWTSPSEQAAARLELPSELEWTCHRGEADPPMGWYSAQFGQRTPSVTLLGAGRVDPAGTELTSSLQFES